MKTILEYLINNHVNVINFPIYELLTNAGHSLGFYVCIDEYGMNVLHDAKKLEITLDNIEEVDRIYKNMREDIKKSGYTFVSPKPDWFGNFSWCSKEGDGDGDKDTGMVLTNIDDFNEKYFSKLK